MWIRWTTLTKAMKSVEDSLSAARAKIESSVATDEKYDLATKALIEIAAYKVPEHLTNEASTAVIYHLQTVATQALKVLSITYPKQ